MDFLEKKTNNLLQRLRKLQEEQCCLHIDQQIGLWYQNQMDPNSLRAFKSSPTQESDETAEKITPRAETPQPPTDPDSTTQQNEEQQDQIITTMDPTTPPSASCLTVGASTTIEADTFSPSPASLQNLQDGDERTIGCFLSNMKHLESFDSDATESTSSNDSYDELEGFSHEDIPPKRSNYHSYQQPSTSHNHQASSSTHHHQTLHQRRISNHYNSTGVGASATIQGNHDLLDLKKKAIWKWATERSRLASRWTWLQAQVADLEFRIRGQNDATMHARAYKTPPLPPVLPEDSCSRTVPLNKDFRRRRLIKASQILSDSNKKLVKFSHVPCICSSLPQTVAPCLSCNGRYNYLKQIEGENAPIPERISLLDPCCHPVLSFPDDLTLGSQLSYLLKQETINRKPTKGRPGRKKGSTAANLAAAAANADKNAKHSGKKGKYYHGMVGRPPGSQSGLKNPSQTMITSNKLRRKYRKHSTTNNYDSNNWVGSNNHAHSSRRNKRIRRTSSMNESSVCSESSNQYRSNHFSNNNLAQNVTRRRRSEQSAYDIDNIVIPFSIAATTRVEILEYKEIMTPSWRVWENGTCQTDAIDEDVEDTSDEAYILRHSKGESEEKKRFSLKPPKNTTINNTNNSSSATTNNNNETKYQSDVN